MGKLDLCLAFCCLDMRNDLPKEDRAWTCHASSSVLPEMTVHIRTSNHNAVERGFGRWNSWRFRVFYEKRSLGVRSWSGKTLGNNSHLNKSKQRQVYNIYLGNRGRNGERNRERMWAEHIHTFIYTYCLNARDFIRPKVKHYLKKNQKNKQQQQEQVPHYNKANCPKDEVFLSGRTRQGFHWHLVVHCRGSWWHSFTSRVDFPGMVETLSGWAITTSKLGLQGGAFGHSPTLSTITALSVKPFVYMNTKRLESVFQHMNKTLGSY